jgi:hypothetical protein
VKLTPKFRILNRVPTIQKIPSKIQSQTWVHFSIAGLSRKLLGGNDAIHGELVFAIAPHGRGLIDEDSIAILFF